MCQPTSWEGFSGRSCLTYGLLCRDGNGMIVVDEGFNEQRGKLIGAWNTPYLLTRNE